MIGSILTAVVLFGALADSFAEPRGGAPLRLGRLVVSGAAAGLVMLLLLVLTDRPFFAAVATVVLTVAVVAVSNAKSAALREPLVFVDFAMLKEVPKHPALFLTYFGAVPTVLLLGSLGLCVWAALALETPTGSLFGAGPAERATVLIALAALLAGALWLGRHWLPRVARRLKPSPDPRHDIRRFGLLGSLLLSSVLALDQTGKDALRRSKRRRLAGPTPGPPPDIVVVQSESFFDVRLMEPRIERSLLKRFDACAGRAVCRGRLAVPAWGGCTMRTEFAFLTGLRQEELGLDRFNPYLRFAKRPVWSIAHDLRQLGYRTICVHPFSGRFFDRDRVLPNLGFDRFLDIAAFQDARAFGPYVSDMAVAEKIAELLDETAAPRFIFAITMENHGNWLKGRLPEGDLATVRRAAPDLPVPFLCYLRHLANSDAMIGRLADVLDARGDGVLCVFGDHVPSFPEVFRKAAFTDPRSDYLIWRPDHRGATAIVDAHVAELSDLLLSAARIEAAPSTGVPNRLAIPMPEAPRAALATGAGRARLSLERRVPESD